MMLPRNVQVLAVLLTVATTYAQDGVNNGNDFPPLFAGQFQGRQGPRQQQMGMNMGQPMFFNQQFQQFRQAPQGDNFVSSPSQQIRQMVPIQIVGAQGPNQQQQAQQQLQNMGFGVFQQQNPVGNQLPMNVQPLVNQLAVQQQQVLRQQQQQQQQLLQQQQARQQQLQQQLMQQGLNHRPQIPPSAQPVRLPQNGPFPNRPPFQTPQVVGPTQFNGNNNNNENINHNDNNRPNNNPNNNNHNNLNNNNNNNFNNNNFNNNNNNLNQQQFQQQQFQQQQQQQQQQGPQQRPNFQQLTLQQQQELQMQQQQQLRQQFMQQQLFQQLMHQQQQQQQLQQRPGPQNQQVPNQQQGNAINPQFLRQAPGNSPISIPATMMISPLMAQQLLMNNPAAANSGFILNALQNSEQGALPQAPKVEFGGFVPIIALNSSSNSSSSTEDPNNGFFASTPGPFSGFLSTPSDAAGGFETSSMMSQKKPNFGASKQLESPAKNKNQNANNLPSSNSAKSTQRPHFPTTLPKSASTPGIKPRKVKVGCEGRIGLCDVDDNYPRNRVAFLTSKCEERIAAMYTPLPTSFEEDGSANVSASMREDSACPTEKRFLRPGFAVDDRGKWQVVIQNADIVQRVSLELCRNPQQPCSGLAATGKKSRCVQKFTYTPLMALDPEHPDDCPSMKAVRVPASCVCHIEASRFG